MFSRNNFDLPCPRTVGILDDRGQVILHHPSPSPHLPTVRMGERTRRDVGFGLPEVGGAEDGDVTACSWCQEDQQTGVDCMLNAHNSRFVSIRYQCQKLVDQKLVDFIDYVTKDRIFILIQINVIVYLAILMQFSNPYFWRVRKFFPHTSHRNVSSIYHLTHRLYLLFLLVGAGLPVLQKLFFETEADHIPLSFENSN